MRLATLLAASRVRGRDKRTGQVNRKAISTAGDAGVAENSVVILRQAPLRTPFGLLLVESIAQTCLKDISAKSFAF